MHDLIQAFRFLNWVPRPYWRAVIFMCTGLCVAAAKAGDMDAFYASAVWTGNEIINEAVLLVEDGKIIAVGARVDVDVPVEAKVHELGNVTLIPGLVISQSNLVESTRSDEYAVTPQVRAVDGFDPFNDYDALLAGGITTVQISPAENRLIPGQGAVVKLAGDDPTSQILIESESLRIVLTQEALSPPTVYEPKVGAVSVDRPLEPTRPQLATSLAQAVVGLRALLAEAGEIADGKASDDVGLSALADLIGKRRTVRWTAESAAEVQSALELSMDARLNWLLVDPIALDGLLARTDWQAENVKGVVLNLGLRPGRISNPSIPSKTKEPDLPLWTRAAKLIDAGAGKKLALRPASDEDLDKILYLASVLGRAGISHEQILSMLTVNPAGMMGVADRVGSLAAGLDADFVVLSGEPLAAATRVLSIYIDGRKVFDVTTNNDSKLISAGHIVTPSGIIKNGKIAIVDGKIQGAGSSVSTPKAAAMKDFGQAYVVPGFVDMATRLGIGGPLSETIPLGTKLGELLSRNDDQIALARQGGVTTALFSSTRLPSPVVAFKLGDEPKSVKDPVALRFSITDNLTAAEASLRRTLQTGKSYADSWKKYDADFAEYEKQLKEYEAAKQKYDEAIKAAEAKKAADAKKQEEEDKKASEGDAKSHKPASGGEPKPAGGHKPEAGDKPSEDGDKTEGSDSKDAASSPTADVQGKTDTAPKAETEKLVEPKKPEEPKKPTLNDNLEPYRALLDGKIVAIVEVSESKAAELAVKLFRTEFGLKTAVVSGAAAVEQARLLAKNEVLAVVGPEVVAEEDGELVNFAAVLSLAQVPIAFQSNALTGVKELPQAISYAVFEGLGSDDALKGLTTGPCKFLGLDSIGSIEAGKDADLVILSGPPLELASEVLAVMIDGQWVYEKESD